jgi:hypothetical protein
MTPDRHVFLDVGLNDLAQASASILEDKFRYRNAFGSEDVHGEAFGFELFLMLRKIVIEVAKPDMARLVKIEKKAVIVDERRNVKRSSVMVGRGRTPSPSVFALADAPASWAITLDDLIDPVLR